MDESTMTMMEGEGLYDPWLVVAVAFLALQFFGTFIWPFLSFGSATPRMNSTDRSRLGMTYTPPRLSLGSEWPTLPPWVEQDLATHPELVLDLEKWRRFLKVQGSKTLAFDFDRCLLKIHSRELLGTGFSFTDPIPYSTWRHDLLTMIEHSTTGNEQDLMVRLPALEDWADPDFIRVLFPYLSVLGYRLAIVSRAHRVVLKTYLEMLWPEGYDRFLPQDRVLTPSLFNTQANWARAGDSRMADMSTSMPKSEMLKHLADRDQIGLEDLLMVDDDRKEALEIAQFQIPVFVTSALNRSWLPSSESLIMIDPSSPTAEPGLFGEEECAFHLATPPPFKQSDQARAGQQLLWKATE